jgi:5-methyltetrahydropteroyltriglutamate--homocysteine methyltransferase
LPTERRCLFLAVIPPERLRMHLRWSNYEGPHHCDVPLAEIIDIAFTARPATISFEAANPRHAYEWTLFDPECLRPGGSTLGGSGVRSRRRLQRLLI